VSLGALPFGLPFHPPFAGSMAPGADRVYRILDLYPQAGSIAPTVHVTIEADRGAVLLLLFRLRKRNGRRVHAPELVLAPTIPGWDLTVATEPIDGYEGWIVTARSTDPGKVLRYRLAADEWAVELRAVAKGG
jgi:hypothetical protein